MKSIRFWIAAVSENHVRKGKEWGIMQVCHGKPAPLKRIHKDDWVLFYSAKKEMKGKVPLQEFTALARAKDEIIFQVEQFPGFHPFRRKVEYFECESTPIRPLIRELEFIPDKNRWGYPFRYGLLQVSEKDFNLIVSKMNVANEAGKYL